VRAVELVVKSSAAAEGNDDSASWLVVGVPSFADPGVRSTEVLAEAARVSRAATVGKGASAELVRAVGGSAVADPMSPSIEVSASVVEIFGTAVAERGSVAGVVEAAITLSVSAAVRGAKVLPAIAAEVRMRFSHPSE
jgi:hypothetical protein